MSLPFGFVPPMDQIPESAMQQWLFHRGFTTADERYTAAKQAKDETLTFIFGDTSYYVRWSQVIGATWYDIWYAPVSRSIR